MYRVLIRRTSEQRCVWCKLLYFEHQGNFKENFLLFSRVGTLATPSLRARSLTEAARAKPGRRATFGRPASVSERARREGVAKDLHDGCYF